MRGTGGGGGRGSCGYAPDLKEKDGLRTPFARRLDDVGVSADVKLCVGVRLGLREVSRTRPVASRCKTGETARRIESML